MQIIRPDTGSDPLGPAGLGKVPTLGGDVSTSIPPPGGTSATQAQQSGTTATQAAAQAIVIPPPPYAIIQKLDPSGALGTWFQTLNRKLGGYSTVYLVTVATTAPFSGNGTTTAPLAMAQASATADGYLLKADWATFNGKVPAARSISTTTPLTGGGDLSANRTLSIPAATALVDGYLQATDFATFAGKYTPGSDLTTGKIGFNGATPLAKPTISGSRGGNAALASLLTQLAAYGLITDGTTA